MPSRTIRTASCISTALCLTLVTKAAEPASAPATQATPTKVVIVDDFESYPKLRSELLALSAVAKA